MITPGVFAATGLLLVALHVARPDLLRRLVDADTRLWWFVPGMTMEALDVEGRYQRLYRRVAVAAVATWTLLNLALFALSYVIPLAA